MFTTLIYYRDFRISALRDIFMGVSVWLRLTCVENVYVFVYAKFIYSGIMFNQALISNIWWSECWIFGHLVIIKYWSDVERNQNFNWDITFFWLWWISSLKMWWKSNNLTSRYRFQICFYTKHDIRGKPCPCKRLWYRIHNSNTLFEKHYRNMKRLGNLGNRRF